MNAFVDQHDDDSMRFSLSSHGIGMRLGQHFTLMEMACKDGSDVLFVHPSLIVALNTIRRHFNTAVSINSGYRTKSHNARIGGSSDSRHLYGLAADIHVWGKSPSEVAEYAKQIGMGGVKAYRTFTHVDVWKNRTW